MKDLYTDSNGNIIMMLVTKEQIERHEKFLAHKRNFPPGEIQFTLKEDEPILAGDFIHIKLPRYNKCQYLITKVLGKEVTAEFMCIVTEDT